MKTIRLSLYFCIGVLLTLAVSCKKDLGKYDYTTVNTPVLDTTQVPASYSIERYANLIIDPKIRMNGIDTTTLTYKWQLYKTTVATGQTNVPRVLSTLRRLNVPIADQIGLYNVELIVTDTKNQAKTNIVFDLSVSAGMEYGVLVLHTAGTTSDVDFLVTRNAVPLPAIPEKRIRNLYLSATGAGLPGIGRFISPSRRTSFSAIVTNWVTVGTSTQLQRVSGNDFSFLRDNGSLFLRPGTVINPQAHNLSDISSYETLINDGKMYFTNASDQLVASYSAALTGDYYLAPFTVSGASGALIAVGYDQKYGRFIRPTSATAGTITDFRTPGNTAQPFNLTNIGMDMVGMDRGISNYTLAFFKEKTGTRRWLYVINFATSDNGLLGISSSEMTNLPEIDQALFYQGNKASNICYYGTAGKIYLYDYTTSNRPTVGFTAPAGETITCMKVYKPTPNANLAAVDGTLLYVATWDGTQGRVYELGINPTTAVINPTPLNKFEGFGRVADITAKPRGAGNL
ncbi:PKD-like family lipoprotein [Pedobacter sp. MR2016-24]|uniref:PKD-like family lipoprotein n=1 Tax=Pedobacter sp. MR2016-24 TaxID=2994466 RepID=UPI0022461EBE|nr:PKD-like family lipoprotein [Pedobacter sp. MR2016-24]MCX2483162.1 PKD-like family lipoprotein [Pedobacter sp. MR2016-24]